MFLFLCFLGFWSDHIQFLFPYLQARSRCLKFVSMGFIRKKLNMALGLHGEGSPSTSQGNGVDGRNVSIDSGYHSMIAEPKRGTQGGLSQATTFVTSGMESSPERSSRKLHKAISTSFSGAMQAFSNSVRSTTSYIYPTAGEPELPSSEWAECETPKKLSRRASIMSSVRSRKQRCTPRTSDAKIESPVLPQSPVPVRQGKAPALQVEIPNPCLSYESLGRTSLPKGAQLLAGVKLPAGPKNLWPGPTRLTVDQASGNNRKETVHPVSSDFNDPYLEQEDKLQSGLSSITSVSELALESSSPEINHRYQSDDKGYSSEMESNADVSDSDGLALACLKYVAAGSPDARTSSPYHHKDLAPPRDHVASSASPPRKTISPRMSSSVPSGLKPSKPETLDGIAEQAASLHLPGHCASFEDDCNPLFQSCDDTMTLKARSPYKRLPPDVYDADAESLESSMGSRAAWDRHRADRERRYMEVIDMAPNTESDEEVGPELELKRSPSKKRVHYAEELVQGTDDIEGSKSTPRYPIGALCYAVEAIDRPAFPVDELAYATEDIEKQAVPVGDLAYAVEAIERSSVTTFDPLETVFQQRPMLRLSDTTDEQETLQVSGPQDLSPSRTETSSSPPATLSPSRVELPSSPEPSPVDVSAPSKSTIMTMRLTDEELMTYGAGNLDGRSIRRFSSEPSDISGQSSPEQESAAALENAYEVGLKAGGLFIPTYLSRPSKTGSVGEDAYEAGLRAAGIAIPTYTSDGAPARPALVDPYERDLTADPPFTQFFTEISRGTYRERLEAGYTPPKTPSRKGAPFEHSKAASAFSDDTEDSCANMTHSPSCKAPPPFPSLHLQSESAHSISSAVDAFAIDGDEHIRIAGTANLGINPLLPSPFDGPGDRNDEADLEPFHSMTLDEGKSPKDYHQVTGLGQHDLQSPSSDVASSTQSPSNINTPQDTFNAAKLPNFVSPCLIASRKARRKQKKSLSGIGAVECVGYTMDPSNNVSEPGFGSSKREHNKSNAFGKTQTPHSECTRIARGSVQKPSPNRQLSKKNRHARNQASLEDFTESVSGSVRWLDPSSESKSSNKGLSGQGRGVATLPETSRPPQMREFAAGKKASPNEIRGNTGSAVQDSRSCFEPEFSIKHFDFSNDSSTLWPNRKPASTSYAGHELDSVLLTNPFMNSRHELDEDLQQRNDKKAVHFGSVSEPDKDGPHTQAQRKNGKPPPEVEKRIAVQRELERKSDRACTRLAGKLKSGAHGDDYARENDSAHKEGRPPWRP